MGWTRQGCVVTVAILVPVGMRAGGMSSVREAGYLYLSPRPGAEHVAVETRSVVMRFRDTEAIDGIDPTADWIGVTGEWMMGGAGLASDLDGDGRVDGTDFGILGRNWSGAGDP